MTLTVSLTGSHIRVLIISTVRSYGSPPLAVTASSDHVAGAGAAICETRSTFGGTVTSSGDEFPDLQLLEGPRRRTVNQSINQKTRDKFWHRETLELFGNVVSRPWFKSALETTKRLAHTDPYSNRIQRMQIEYVED